MLDKISILLVLSLPVFSFSCTPDKSEIRTACEKDAIGNYLIKWETFPPIGGIVKIYESNTPDSFNIQSPIAEQEISIGFKSVFATRSKERSYFQLIFDKKYSVITAERNIPTENIYNLRDVGGYYNKNKRATKWGTLYRSSTLSNATRNDIKTLNMLHIRTVIDLRTDEERLLYPSKYKAKQVFNLPLASVVPLSFFQKVISEEMKKGDVVIKLQDMHFEILENNTDYFIQLFDILSDEKNYPVLISCSLGKDRVGITTALILAALDVPMDQIIQDYMLSNNYIEFEKLVPNAGQYSVDVQEALTTLFSSHEQTLGYAFSQIEKKYGSLSNYLEKELHLSHKKREKFKDLLLYQRID